MLALSLDMGGTHVGCGVVRDKELLISDSLAIQDGQPLISLLPSIEKKLRALLAACGEDASACAGLTIGFPGIVDARTMTILSTLKKYEDVKESNLIAWSRDVFGLPLRIENDARMALLGESFAGCVQDTRSVVMMTLGTGIGGAAMIEGNLLRGLHAHAGCLGGHMPVDFHGRLCSCGNIGCAEAEAAGWSLPGIVRDHPKFAGSVLSKVEQIDFRALFDAADQGDVVAMDIRQRCLEVWSACAIALIHAYDPEVVVIGGGVMHRAEIIVPFVQGRVDKHAWAAWGKPQVRAAKLGENAGLLGAIPLLTEVFE